MIIIFTLYYISLVVAVLAAVRLPGERLWPTAPLVYMPRWLFLPPLLVLALVADRSQCRTLWLVHGITALVVAGPLMQIALPIGRLRARPPPGPRFRIMTLNRGQRGIDAARLIRLIERERIQLICLQEGGGDPILREYWEQGWYRTDFVASRFPVLSVRRGLTSGQRPLPLKWGGLRRKTLEPMLTRLSNRYVGWVTTPEDALLARIPMRPFRTKRLSGNVSL